MTPETFEKALTLTQWLEGQAKVFGYNLILLSGGEPTEHPDILAFIALVVQRGFKPFLLTNGMWLSNTTMLNQVLELGTLVQVTNVAGLYPQIPPIVNRRGVTYIDSLSMTIEMGRFKGQTSDVPARKSPACFNLRSIVHSGMLDNLPDVIAHIRRRVAMGKSGSCIPSISADGTMVAGETRFCHSIGTVDSTPEELFRNLKRMTCKKCGLTTKLPLEYRQVIGER